MIAQSAFLCCLVLTVFSLRSGSFIVSPSLRLLLPVTLATAGGAFCKISGLIDSIGLSLGSDIVPADNGRAGPSSFHRREDVPKIRPRLRDGSGYGNGARRRHAELTLGKARLTSIAHTDHANSVEALEGSFHLQLLFCGKGVAWARMPIPLVH